jgi:actin-related protein 9
MFPAEKQGEWEATKIRQRPAPTIANGAANGSHPQPSNDVDMPDAPEADSSVVKTEAPAVQPLEDSSASDPIYEEDPTSEEGAVYPLRGGRIENWSCFLALLTHIYNTLSPPFHTPVLVISQPCWSARDHELLTQFFFENFRIPAFCLMDAALASCYAYGVPSATVIDIGHEKCDVTAVSEFVACDAGRGIAVAGCGGHDMTRRLLHLLEHQGFNETMCEQLKRGAVCEILPVGTELPGKRQETVEATNPAAAASTGAMDSGADARDVDGSKVGQAPRGPGLGTEVGEEGGNGEEEDNDGVLDVASIVAKGNASEFLAKREREKAEKAAARKAAGLEAARPVRLKNSERQKTTFAYEEYIPYEDGVINGNGIAPSRKRKRDVEVGIERFMAASPGSGTNDGILDTIAATIHRTIMAVPEVANRSSLWDNLIILGNGSRVRGESCDTSQDPDLLTYAGFTTALLSTLAARYTLSPSTATIFTSELPSNFSTPLPTGGTNTPVPGHPAQAMHHPAAHGVNPLLVAATRHANQQMQPAQSLQVPGAPDPSHQHHQRGHNQTPTSIKTVKPPEYFPEWKDPGVSGMEEAGFLGAQVAAKVLFVVDGGISKGFLTRGEYNDMGPAGIHDCAM